MKRSKRARRIARANPTSSNALMYVGAAVAGFVLFKIGYTRGWNQALGAGSAQTGPAQEITFLGSHF
jgi:hypothetical protein